MVQEKVRLQYLAATIVAPVDPTRQSIPILLPHHHSVRARVFSATPTSSVPLFSVERYPFFPANGRKSPYSCK
jgi:hypothetical protein